MDTLPLLELPNFGFHSDRLLYKKLQQPSPEKGTSVRCYGAQRVK